MLGLYLYQYSYNRSQILQQVKCTKQVNIAKEIANFKTQQQRNKTKNIKSRATHFQQIHLFSVIFLHAWVTIFGSFSYLRE